MIVIDGEQFKIDVLSVKRSADFLDKYAERLANGHLRRELIGVYFNYKLQFGPGLDRKEYARLWDKLTEPAATGMGKTQLALLILYQLSQKGYDIYLADYKGVDFGPEYRKTGHYADDDAALEQMLDSVVHELNHRRTEFSIAGCANLEEYVQTTGEELHRIVVILDETSMILDTTGRDKDGKAVVASITNKLLAIGRLGRALGIHLLVATQRPDVGSVPGSLKAQLDGRICGHTADAQSSIVILDDGSAAKLPAIPGRFIIRNGSGSDEIIQAYYYHQ